VTYHGSFFPVDFLMIVSLPLSFPAAPPGRTGWPWDVAAKLTEKSNVLPRITVMTPSFNQGEFLEETIRSVLLQGYPNLEYIVVDGGSTDNSGNILDKYSPFISHVIREKDRGQSDAISKGLSLATGKWFNWINSDDLLLPGTLLELGCDAYESTDLFTFRVIACGVGIKPYTMLNDNLTANAMLRADRYSFSQPGLWFRTDKVQQCGGIDRNFNYGFDWDLIIRYLCQNPRVHYSDTDGAMFRLHGESKTVLETQKTNLTENRFWQESWAIRDKLETLLSPMQRKASLLGREREPWNRHLVEVLDDINRSPLAASLSIIFSAMKNPRVCFTGRTAGSVLRLLSRYVRPKFYRQPTDSAP